MKQFKSLLYSQKLAPYIFVAPFVIVFLVFFLYPIVSTVIMSFQSVIPGQTHFIGIENYRKMWNSSFITALKNSAVYMVVTCAILIPVPMALAAMLNSRKMPAKGFFRSVLFLPALICVVVAGITFRLIPERKQTAEVQIDGMDRGKLEAGDEIFITGSDRTIRLLRIHPYHFFSVVRSKLIEWGSKY